MDDKHCHGTLRLSAAWDLTRLAVTRPCILTSSRSTARSHAASAQLKRSPTPVQINAQVASSVDYFAPVHFRRRISGRVSYYAFFKGWLLLSQPPRCQRNSTSFLTLSKNLGTLDCGQGCFPLDHGASPPQSHYGTLGTRYSEFD